MWAYGIWEYVKCNSCNKIHSKEDVFWHLSKDIYLESVTKIEKIIGQNILCNECGSDTTFIYDVDKYMEEIRKRYNESDESFLTVFRDENWEIRWFEDGYMDSFENIFEREFKTYYIKLYYEIYEIIESIINIPMPKKILLCCSVWMEQKFASFFTLYNIMQNFFSWINNRFKGEQKLWLCEAVVWWLPHSLYHVAWTKRLWIPENEDLYDKINNISIDFKSDIFINIDITNNFINKMSIPVKEYMKLNRKKMNEVLIR
jgi:hypothetical protein